MGLVLGVAFGMNACLTPPPSYRRSTLHHMPTTPMPFPMATTLAVEIGASLPMSTPLNIFPASGDSSHLITGLQWDVSLLVKVAEHVRFGPHFIRTSIHSAQRTAVDNVPVEWFDQRGWGTGLILGTQWGFDERDRFHLVVDGEMLLVSLPFVEADYAGSVDISERSGRIGIEEFDVSHRGNDLKFQGRLTLSANWKVWETGTSPNMWLDINTGFSIYNSHANIGFNDRHLEDAALSSSPAIQWFAGSRFVTSAGLYATMQFRLLMRDHTYPIDLFLTRPKQLSFALGYNFMQSRLLR